MLQTECSCSMSIFVPKSDFSIEFLEPVLHGDSFHDSYIGGLGEYVGHGDGKRLEEIEIFFRMQLEDGGDGSGALWVVTGTDTETNSHF